MIRLTRLVGAVIGLAVLAAQPPASAAERKVSFDQPSAGDVPGEEQPPPQGYAIPPAPALSPADAIKAFRLPPGYRIELLASEPLVNTPVAIDFDPDGRMWVVEMRGYQNNPEGSDRLEANGRIVVLEDTDQDGKMDRSTVYMDGLVLPRAIRVLSDGVLVGEPPYVWHTRDTNGDLRMDEKTIVVDDYGVRDSNPGHAPNGLLRGMDNWLHSPTYTARLRRVDGAWVKDAAPMQGHFGMGLDDFGRTYTNTNSIPLRANFISSHYQLRNPNHEGGGGVFEPITADDQREIFPIRPNPGANRGYTKGILRPDGRLVRNTAGCGISIFRGDRLPAEVQGNHFFCEPAANLIRRTVLTERADGTISGVNPHAKAEFLASTDERFRPVNTGTAPDGTLYVVDMYRGILESHPFVTTYLKRQIFERGLDRPLDRGRIWRVVHESMRPGPQPRLSRMAAADLVGVLQHPNGWWRDTAQRLLVERGDLSVAAALRRLARGESAEIPRLHALWTLEGLGALTADDGVAALADRSPRLRHAAVRLAEPWLQGRRDERIRDLVIKAIDDPAAVVRLQVAASLGEMKDAQGEAALAALLTRHAAQPYVMDAIVFGLQARELEFLQRLGQRPEWAQERADYQRALTALAACVFREGKTKRIHALLAWTAADRRPAWHQLAVLRSVARPMNVPEKISLPRELVAASDERIRAAAATLTERLRPEEAGANRPFSKAEQDLLKSGTKLYGVYCAQCHQPNGRGLPDLAPALVGSKWVLGTPATLAKIVLGGKQDGNLIMPPWGNVLDDGAIAALVTYIRHEWGNAARPVLPESVRRARAESRARTAPWNEESLSELAASKDNK